MLAIFRRLFKFRPMLIPQATWDTQFVEGKWNSLWHISQLAHNSVIIGYFNHFAKCESILDLGCGDGALAANLHFYKDYLGVDFSSSAIVKALKSQHKDFVQADIESFTPNKLYKSIVFNESLYCLKNPITTLKRYEKYLDSNGVFIISMFGDKDTDLLWRLIDSNYHTEDSTKVISMLKASWIIKVVKPLMK